MTGKYWNRAVFGVPILYNGTKETTCALCIQGNQYNNSASTLRPEIWFNKTVCLFYRTIQWNKSSSMFSVYPGQSM